MGDYIKTHMLTKKYIDRLYSFIQNSNNILDGNLLYQLNDSLLINPKLANLSAHTHSL